MSRNRKKQSQNFSREAVSVIAFFFGLIIMLMILSYHPGDNPNLEIENNSIKIKNLLGPLGAAIADPLFNYTLGYPVLALPLLIMIISVQTFRGRSYQEYLRPVIMLFFWALILSVILAIPEAFETGGNMREYFPSGMVGGKSASLLVKYVGNFGTVLILSMVVICLSILSLRVELRDQLKSISAILKKAAAMQQKFITEWRRSRQARKKSTAEKKRAEQLARFQRHRPAEIKTTIAQDTEQKSDPSAEKSSTTSEIPVPPATVIKTVKQEEEDIAADTQKAVQEPINSEIPENANGADVDFEVREEARVEEVDYDSLVKESIAKYKFPSVDLLDPPPAGEISISREELRANAELLEAKLLDFGLQAKVIRVTAGPVITLYELQPAPGVKVSQIVSLANDLALAMEARGIRMVAPIPGKAAIGIEIPNRQPQTVFLKPMIRSESYAESNFVLPLALGKTINGEVYCADLTKMPHLLIAGSTGSGKSVGINSIIASILYRVDPGKVKFVMIDPKKIELSIYRSLSEHYLLWRTDLDEEVITKPANAVSILNTMVLEMEARYDKLAHLGVRSIQDYNTRIRQGGPRIKEEKLQALPYIVVIIDELADLMMVAAKEVENPISRLTQMARAVGIHLILATQRPSVDVITGVIKANFPARIAYMVTVRADSKTILDANGAEQLLGNGDMLYQPPGEPRPIRLQNPLITTQEVDRLIAHIRKQPKFPHYSLPQPQESRQSGFDGFDSGGGDMLYEDAKRIVVQHQQGSISLLQRRLKIGYSRAARLIDEMEEEGVVGPADGSKPRQVFYLPEDL